ncbi:TPA: hypothetical protein HA249_04785 [Candidatus Woesearchaeota archaeon]|nr:hypothetical protein [Candidatus Woesearchaeota archaeon]
MITLPDQEQLFKIISRNLSSDVTTYAFGGTAMMFYGYKGETKDIDLFFEDESQRKPLIQAIESMGYAEFSPLRIYIPEKLRDPHRPKMFKRDDERFDLFVKKIFKTVMSQRMKDDVYAVHEFKENKRLTVKVLRTEIIVMLKAVTERDKDFEDILTIIKKDKNFNWDYFLDEVVWQSQNGDSWVALDTEKMMKELQEYVFIPEKHFKRVHGAV